MLLPPLPLLATTVTTIGLIAAWATASRRHWLSRVMLFLGVAALPLLIPAHELSIAFVTLGATIAAGIGVWKWLRRRAAGESRASRFSTQDLLLAVIPVAAVCAVVVRMPPLGVDRWVGMLTSGVVGGLVFLVGLWLVAGVPWNRWVRVTLAALTGLAALLIARAWGELLASLTYQAGWPTESLIAWERQDVVSRLPWIGIAVAAILLAACAAWAWRPWSNTERQRAISTFAYGMLTAVVLAPPMLALYLLDNPTPLPRHEVPVPNGIDDFDQARRLLLIPLGVKTVDDADTGIASQAEIDTMLRRQERVAELVKQGLTKEVRLWVAHSQDFSTPMFEEHLAKVGDYKAVARSLDSYAGSLASEDLPAEAAIEYATLAQYGASLSRGGLLVDAMVAAACGGQGAEGLYSVRKSTPPEAYATILRAISEADERADDFDSIILRELILSQRMGGWTGRLVDILGINAELQRPAFKSSRVSYQQFIAALRLLQLEYALLIYHDLHGAWPEELRQLTPGIMKSLPADPFADDSAAFRYQRQGDGYQLYSVWADGADDHGEPPRETNGQISWNPDLSGDLSLGALYDVE